VSQHGSFSVLEGQIDGRPLVAMIDMGLRDSDDKQTLPFFLSVSTPLINPGSNGLPSRADAEELNAWEDAIEAELHQRGRYAFVGRVTCNANRELPYYVESQHPTVEALQSLSRTHCTRPFTFACERDEAWQHARFWFDRD